MPPVTKDARALPTASGAEVDLPALYRRRVAEEARVSERIDATRRAEAEANSGMERLLAAGHEVPPPGPAPASALLSALRAETAAAWSADNGPARDAVTRARLDFLRLEAMYQRQYEEAIHLRDHVRALLARAFEVQTVAHSTSPEVAAARAEVAAERAAKEEAQAQVEALRRELAELKARSSGGEPGSA